MKLPQVSHRNTILLVVFALCLMMVYGANLHLDLLKKSTIENIEVHGIILHYSYTYNFELFIEKAHIEITNAGPLDATLYDANITLSSINESSTTIHIDHAVKLPAGGSYNHTIAPPDLVIRDESRVILDKMKEHYVDYEITLKARASCGTYEGPMEKTSSGCLVFLHPPPYQLPFLLQHGVFTDMGVNQTLVIHSPLMVPLSFRVGHLGDTWINREHYWGLSMNQQEKIRFSFNATEPVHFQLVLSSNPDFDSWDKDKVVIDMPSTSSFSTNFTAPQQGLYVFVFRISQPDSVATVIFDGYRFWP